MQHGPHDVARAKPGERREPLGNTTQTQRCAGEARRTKRALRKHHGDSKTHTPMHRGEAPANEESPKQLRHQTHNLDIINGLNGPR